MRIDKAQDKIQMLETKYIILRGIFFKKNEGKKPL